MIRGLWFFAQLALVVVAAVFLADQKGAVSIAWRGWLFETSFGVLAILIAGLALAMILLWRLWRTVLGTPHAVSRFRSGRRRTRGEAALLRSMTALTAGDGALALRHASDAEAISDPALAHLAAAEAAEAIGDAKRAELEYGRLRARPDTALIGLKGLIGVAERGGDTARALALAVEARNLAPKSPWALRRLIELQGRAGAYADAERTLSEAAKLAVFPPADADRLLARLLLARGLAAEAAGRDAEALDQAEQAHKLDPALAAATLLGMRMLARSGRVAAAERLAAAGWAAAPDPALARAWIGLAPAGDPTARLRQAEKLHALDRGSLEGRLALAEAELLAGRWAEARGRLAGPDAQWRTPQVFDRYCRIMTYLESAAGNEPAARAWFEKSMALPEPPPAGPAYLSENAFPAEPPPAAAA
jgi:HemY protein